MNKKSRCCRIDSVFGYSLYEGVIFVGISSALIATATFFTSILGLTIMVLQDNEQYGRHPLVFSNLIMVLIFIPMSLYQIILSLLLLWQAIKMKGNVFLCSLWFSSHTSILAVYALLFVAKTAACCFNSYFIMGIVTLVAGILYEALFIYFEIIVNSYLNSLDCDIYY